MKYLLVLLLACSLPLIAQKQARTGAKISVYNSNFSVVNESVDASLQKGTQLFTLKDLPIGIIPESVKLNFAGTTIEKSYHFDEYNLQTILAKSIGTSISLVNVNGKGYSGKLLAFNNPEILLESSDSKIIALPNYSDFVISLDNADNNFSSKPYISWLLSPDKQGLQNIDLTYETNNLGWSLDYTLYLNNDESYGTLEAWASIANNTGVDFNDADLSLIAGQVKRVSQAMPYGESEPEMRMNFAMDKSAGASRQVNEEPMSDYYAMQVQGKISLPNNESKQILLFDAKNVGVKKRYHVFATNYEPTEENLKASVVLYFDNKKSNNLGNAFPQGILRVYKKSGEKSYFLGEDIVKNTPQNEVVEIETGRSFDLVAKETLVSNEFISDDKQESKYEITLKNDKIKEKAEVVIFKNLEYNSQVVNCSNKYELIGRNQIKIYVELAPGTEQKVSLTTRLVRR